MSVILKRLLLIFSSVIIIIIIMFIYQRNFGYSNRLLSIEAINTNTSSSEYNIVIDTEASELYLFCNGKLQKTYPCAGGKASTPSPIGVWTIVHKATWGEGFGGHWMGLNVPWGMYGIHGTIFPNSIGHPASKGCIRMYSSDAAELYKIIPYGTKVKIIDGPYGAFGKGFRTLKSGMYGSDVLEAQKKLKELGYFKGYCNGIFDNSLLNAVYSYQKANMLAPTGKITPFILKKIGFILMD